MQISYTLHSIILRLNYKKALECFKWIMMVKHVFAIFKKSLCNFFTQKENEDEGEEVKKMCLESMIRSP